MGLGDGELAKIEHQHLGIDAVGQREGGLAFEPKRIAGGQVLAVHVELAAHQVHIGRAGRIERPRDLLVTRNGDKLSTLHYLFTLSQQHSMIWVGTGLMPSNAKAATRNDVNYVGSYAGAMAQSPSDASPAEMLPGDLETARLFGARVAAVAARFNK